MALFDSAVRKFLTMDTAQQAVTLKRVGLRTECADNLLDHLAASEPERFRALSARMDDEWVAMGVTV